ncbi:MAG: tyrosine-type recombinase/integrase [Candidatus Acidiferrum sp.]
MRASRCYGALLKLFSKSEILFKSPGSQITSTRTLQRRDTDIVFVGSNGKPLRRNTLRYNFVRLCARAHIQQEHSYSPTPGMHDLRHTFAVHCLEAWVRQGQDLRQKLPLLSGYLGHANLKSTELYLRLVPGGFVKSLASLEKRPAPLSPSVLASM